MLWGWFIWLILLFHGCLFIDFDCVKINSLCNITHKHFWVIRKYSIIHKMLLRTLYTYLERIFATVLHPRCFRPGAHNFKHYYYILQKMFKYDIYIYILYTSYSYILNNGMCVVVTKCVTLLVGGWWGWWLFCFGGFGLGLGGLGFGGWLGGVGLAFQTTRSVVHDEQTREAWPLQVYNIHLLYIYFELKMLAKTVGWGNVFVESCWAWYDLWQTNKTNWKDLDGCCKRLMKYTTQIIKNVHTFSLKKSPEVKNLVHMSTFRVIFKFNVCTFCSFLSEIISLGNNSILEYFIHEQNFKIIGFRPYINFWVIFNSIFVYISHFWTK